MHGTVDDVEEARQADLAYRTVRAALLCGSTGYLVVGILVAVVGDLLAVGIAIAVFGMLSTPLVLSALARRHRENLAQYVNPLTGDVTIPGQPLPIPTTTTAMLASLSILEILALLVLVA